MPLETTPFDPSDYLGSPEAQAELLADALASGDPGYITNALGIVARAKGMSTVAREAGVTREALYKALSLEGDPRFSTLLGVIKALDVPFVSVSHQAMADIGFLHRMANERGAPSQADVERLRRIDEDQFWKHALARVKDAEESPAE